VGLKEPQKAINAIDSGRFRDEIVTVPVPQRKGGLVLFDTDEYLDEIPPWKNSRNCVLSILMGCVLPAIHQLRMMVQLPWYS